MPKFRAMVEVEFEVSEETMGSVEPGAPEEVAAEQIWDSMEYLKSMDESITDVRVERVLEN